MRLLVRIDMPHDVVGQAKNLVPSPLRHLRETFGLGLVFEGVAGEVNA